MEITCSACGSAKDSTEFYAHNRRCKPCARSAAIARRLANLEAVRDYDRKRALLPHRIASTTRVTREWRRRNKDKMAAHNKANRAPMQSPVRCQGCAQERRLEKHHPDYSKPLLVVWLCKPCHAIADKIRRIQESA
jgi:hypothetical protein